ncbi:MAG: hypothetical protein ABSA52_04990 [Candidatus Binatia bacterium]|jgi:hypothetical protein
MPRTTMELPHAVEYLSILDAEGNVDTAIEPKLDDALLLRLYRTMLLARRFNERMLTRPASPALYARLRASDVIAPPRRCERATWRRARTLWNVLQQSLGRGPPPPWPAGRAMRSKVGS